MHPTLPQHDIVLLGMGHTNAHILRMWRMQPIPSARLTCISNYPVATYSGMLPGVLAGLYPPERMEIDLVRLCAAAGARLIVGEVTGLDIPRRELLLADRPPLPFDFLSIGLGSVPGRNGLETDDSLLEVKPMQTFLPRLEERLQLLASAGRLPQGTQPPDTPLRLTIVGGGAGGIEIAFCLPMRVRKVLGEVPLTVTVIPQFILMRTFGWTDTPWAMIVPGLFGSAFGTYLMRQFFRTLPTDLEEAAILDGCTPWQIYWRILLPQTKPAIMVLAVLTWVNVWNDFLWPLVMIQTKSIATLNLGLVWMQGQYVSRWPVLMAASILILLPLLLVYAVAQRSFVRGIATAGFGGR